MFGNTLNDLTIDDDMFTYDKRSVRFINIKHEGIFYLAQNAWSGVLEGEDKLYSVNFMVSSDSKVITRTRRKFWDDVSLRGG